MTKLFGLADIVAGLLFIASFYRADIPRGMMLTFGIYLILKGLIFIVNFFSLIDIAAGVLLVSGWVFIIPPFLLIGLASFLALKGLASLLTFT